MGQLSLVLGSFAVSAYFRLQRAQHSNMGITGKILKNLNVDNANFGQI